MMRIMKLVMVLFSLFLFGCSKHSQEKKVVEYYENGKVKKECSNTECTEYYENGNIYVKYAIKNGKLEGKESIFYEDGSKRISYLKDGKPEGKSILYYPNGEVKAKENYSKGILVGKHLLFDSSGYLFRDSYVISIKKTGRDIRDELLFNADGDTISNSKDIIDYRMPSNIKFNSKEHLVINYKQPKLSNFLVVYTTEKGFNKFFFIQNIKYIDTIFFSNVNVMNIPLSTDKKDEKVIRGFVMNYDTVSVIGDSLTVLDHVERYFEFYYNVR